MIIIRLMGGLGNQLQQYALCQKYISLGKDARLDFSWFAPGVQDSVKAPRRPELNEFKNADYKEASRDDVVRIIGRDDLAGKIYRRIRNSCFTEREMYYPDLFDRDNIYLEGYWAAERYYADIIPVLAEKLRFDTESVPQETMDIASRISGGTLDQCFPDYSSYTGETAVEHEHPFSVAVHIRRGDYLDPENMALFGNIATDGYYEAAISLVREKLPGAHFFIFSDDPAYVRAKYGNDHDKTIVDVNRGENSRFDMWLMSLCDAHICANSTFSFWGARLSRSYADGGLRIRPTIQKNTQTFDHSIMKELWKGWIFIDPVGKVYE